MPLTTYPPDAVTVSAGAWNGTPGVSLESDFASASGDAYLKFTGPVTGTGGEVAGVRFDAVPVVGGRSYGCRAILRHNTANSLGVGDYLYVGFRWLDDAQAYISRDQATEPFNRLVTKNVWWDFVDRAVAAPATARYLQLEVYLYNASGAQAICYCDSVSVYEPQSHHALTGLTGFDDHAQYLLLAGRAGGQTIAGDTASGGNLTINSTLHATKGKILLGAFAAYDEANRRLGLGTQSPNHTLQIQGVASAISSLSLGTGFGSAAFLGDNGLYGLYHGVDPNTGAGWFQVMRNDSAIAYDIIMQPVGGKVLVGGGGLGYGGNTGIGGTVTQGTSKSTGVTLNKICGEITMHNATLNAATIVAFTLTNSAIAAGDVLILNHVTAGSRGAYSLNAQCGAGSAVIYVRNNTTVNLSEAIVIRFAVVKAVAA